MFPAILFYIFSVTIILSALMVIFSRDPINSVLFLIFSFVNAAGIFLLAGAEFLALILVLETGMNGTFVALDLILFFVFFEIVLLPMYFMIGIWGDKTVKTVSGFKNQIETRLYASIKFFVFCNSFWF